MKFLYKIAAICTIFISNICNAQDTYKPSDKWPYIFEHFTPAVVYHTAGKGISNVEANVCLADGSLHYIDDGIILQTTSTTIERVEIGNRNFISVNNVLMEILAEVPEGMIVKALTVNLNAPGVEIGFGMTSSTVAASTVDLTAATALGSSLLHSKIAQAAMEAEYGTALNIESQLNFFVNGFIIPANKKDFTETVGKDKANTFLKAYKIKWNDPSTMIPAIAFIKENQ